jgi:hypothetical protein
MSEAPYDAVPYESVLGSGAGGPLSAPTPWAAVSGGIQYAVGGIMIGSPSGGVPALGSVNATSYYVNGVLLNPASYLPFSGGNMTGMLTLFGDPVNPLDAADKRYVDNNVTTINNTLTNYLLLSGGTITGSLNVNGTLTLASNPTAPLQAATKQYVDNSFSGIIYIPDAPSDGSTYGRNNATWTNVIDAGTF